MRKPMREKFRQFMIGRYGTDGLNQFLSMSSIVMLLVSLLTRVSLFTWLGAALLMLPFAVHPGAHVGPLDALFTATSAVCVTGLVVVDTGDTFSLFGQAVIAILIQIGGLGVASIGMGLALVAGRRISLKGRSLVREALNVESLEGMVRLVRAILLVTLICEVAGAVLSFPSFARDHMPLQAVWLSIFPLDRRLQQRGL